MMMMTRWSALLILGLALNVPPTGVQAAEPVLVIVGQGAADLEHVAAQDMVDQLRRLFDAQVSLRDFLPDQHANLVVVGGPKGNKAVREVAGENWPKLSEQGFVLRSFDANGRQGILVGGDSAAATLWAVHEFGHRLGVRHLLRGDIYPEQQPIKLTGFDEVVEPELPQRAWSMLGDSPLGTAAWPLTEQRKLLKQLAKLKFNRVVLEMAPSQPFTSYEFGGITKHSAALWPDTGLTIAADSPGRNAFKGPTEFHNPDFAGKHSAEDMIQAGFKHARGVISQAQRLGMSCALKVSPLEYPSEFAEAVPGLEKSPGMSKGCVVPGAKLGPNDPMLLALATKQLRSYIESYPSIDSLYLSLPTALDWDQYAKGAWEELSRNAGSNAPAIEQLLAATLDDNVARSAKSDLAALAFLQKLLSDSSLLKRADGKVVNVVVSGIDSALFPELDRILPANVSVLDDSAQLLSGEKRTVEARLALSERSVLSQSTLQGSDTKLAQLRDQHSFGFVLSMTLLGESEPTVSFVSRAAWDSKVTARSSHDDLFTTITGKQSVSDRLWLALGHIEAATNLTDVKDRDFAAPQTSMMLKHYQAGDVPAWWTEQNAHYTQAMSELYRSRDGADPRSQPLLYYYAKRSEFVLEYLAAIKAVKEAGVAKAAGDSETATTKLEAAIESLYNAIDTLGDVALDPSDRGLIAILNAHAYRPLTAETERLLESREQ